MKEEKEKKNMKEAAEKKEKEDIEEIMKNLPYLPKDERKAIERKEPRPAALAKGLIKLLQRHAEKDLDGGPFARLERCAQVGLALAEALFIERPDERNRHQFLIALRTALDSGNPALRKNLVNEVIEPKALAKYTELQLASADVQKRRAGQIEYEFQAQRTDAMFEQEKKLAAGSAMYDCKKCNSKKVTCYTQQTRGADEPMTEFYNCLDCGAAWRECP